MVHLKLFIVFVVLTKIKLKKFITLSVLYLLYQYNFPRLSRVCKDLLGYTLLPTKFQYTEWSLTREYHHIGTPTPGERCYFRRLNSGYLPSSTAMVIRRALMSLYTSTARTNIISSTLKSSRPNNFLKKIILL